MLETAEGEPLFSAASLWEATIKAGLGRADFVLDPKEFRRGLLEAGYAELPIDGRHAVAVMALPPLHNDPFDRMLIAQARVERIPLVTSDFALGRYGPPVRIV